MNYHNIAFVLLINFIICASLFVSKEINNGLIIIYNNIWACNQCGGLLWLFTLDFILNLQIIFKIFSYFYHKKIMRFLIETIFHSFIALLLILLTLIIDEYIDNRCIDNYIDNYPDLFDIFENNQLHLFLMTCCWIIIFILSALFYTFKLLTLTMYISTKHDIIINNVENGTNINNDKNYNDYKELFNEFNGSFEYIFSSFHAIKIMLFTTDNINIKTKQH
jgi:hypothetical protein